MENISKDKILVHDSSHGFLRFIKNHYYNILKIEVNEKKRQLENKVNEYAIGFINVNDYDDLLYVKYIESQVKFLLIVSTKKEFDDIKFNDKKVLFLNSFTLKPEIIKQIDLGIKSMA